VGRFGASVSARAKWLLAVLKSMQGPGFTIILSNHADDDFDCILKKK
jgi:hypothetical protein